jgi:hypothetical protein
MVPRKVDLCSGFRTFHQQFSGISRWKHTGWGPSSLAKLVNIIIITIVYDTYNYIWMGL